MGASISMTGMQELLSMIEQSDLNVKEIEEEALQAAAVPILRDAQQTTAFIDRSGKLRDSLKISKVVKKRTGYRVIKVYCARSNGGTYEANLVEFGHSGNTAGAHPFMAPAFENNQAEAVDIVISKLREALMTK